MEWGLTFLGPRRASASLLASTWSREMLTTRRKLEIDEIIEIRLGASRVQLGPLRGPCSRLGTRCSHSNRVREVESFYIVRRWSCLDPLTVAKVDGQQSSC